MRFDENWFSQAGQDKWVDLILKGKKNGYFLDIGAGDGWGDSNTFYFEDKLGWTGICVECGVQDYLKCKSLRKKSITTPLAIWSSETDLSFAIGSHSVHTSGFGLPVKAITLKMLFEKYNVPTEIDYISLDIEGSDVEALKGFPWGTHKVAAWTVEHNLYLKKDPTMKNGIYDILSKNGYIRAVENIACKDSHWGAFEDWYLHEDYAHLNESVDLSFVKKSV